ncbi:MAG: SDR family NAD(P)-dependent oxidoreductase [Pseudomonadota bacterium]
MTASWKSAWIVGASTGIGRDLVLHLARGGVERVYASARSADKLAALAGELPAIRSVPLDVTDLESLRSAHDQIAADGALDLAVFNAGAYSPMGLKEWDLSIIRQNLAVNYEGVVNGLDVVLPAMRARRAGHIAVTASVAGYRGLPNALSYGPTKAALISLCETLHNELRDEGVRLQLINPGFVRTPLTDKNDFEMPQMIEPAEAADEIFKGLQSNKFEIAFPRPFAWQLMALRMLPYPMFFAAMRKMMGH